MNILFIAHTSNPGGSNTAMVNLIRGLISFGNKCFILAPNDGTWLQENIDTSMIPIFTEDYALTIYPRTRNPYKVIKGIIVNIPKWKRAKVKCEEVIHAHAIDIVHTNVGPLDIALEVCQKLFIPHVWHMREFQDRDFNMTFFPSQSFFRKKIMKRNNFNIAITKEIFQYWNLRPTLDRIIYDGVYPSSIGDNSVACYSQRDNVILFAGRVTEAKGTLELLEAFNQFLNKHQDYRLLIAGECRDTDKYASKCKRYVEDNNLSENVSFLGYRNDVYDLLSKSKIFVVASQSEGFGFVTAEAMAMGCLVIGKNTAGTKEQFDNGFSDLGYDIGLRYDKTEDLVTMLSRAANTDYTELVKRAREYALNCYSIEKCSLETHKFYKLVLDNCR